MKRSFTLPNLLTLHQNRNGESQLDGHWAGRVTDDLQTTIFNYFELREGLLRGTGYMSFFQKGYSPSIKFHLMGHTYHDRSVSLVYRSECHNIVGIQDLFLNTDGQTLEGQFLSIQIGQETRVITGSLLFRKLS